MLIDYIESSLKNIFRNKKNKFLIIIFTLLSLLLIIDIMFFYNINSYLNNSINKNMGFRTINVYKDEINYEDGVEELKKIEYIKEVFPTSYYKYGADTDIKINNLNGDIVFVYGTTNTAPKSVFGKQIEDLKPGETICPYLFYPDTGAYDLKIDKNKIIKKEQSLNYEFNAYYLEVKLINEEPVVSDELGSKKFKIVGLYDNQLIMNRNNECYVTPEDIRFFENNLNPHINPEKDNFFVSIVVDKVTNLEKTKKIVKKLGYFANEGTVMYIDSNSITTITILFITFFVIILGVSFLILMSYIKKKLKNESKFIGIQRACGYNQQSTIIIQITEILISVIISIIISFVLYIVLYYSFAKKIFESTTYIGFEISNNILILTSLFIIVIILVVFISYILLAKELKKPIAYLLKEE